MIHPCFESFNQMKLYAFVNGGYHESVIGVSGSYFKFVKQKKLANFFKVLAK
jgi:hypothetical protein